MGDTEDIVAHPTECRFHLGREIIFDLDAVALGPNWGLAEITMKKSGARIFWIKLAGQNYPKRTIIDQNGPKWTKNGPKWTKMDQNEPKWTKIIQN